MRVVIDTNVLISATFWTGKPKQLLNKARRREIIFLTSEILLDELKGVLVNKKKPFRLSWEEAEQVVIAMRELAEVVETNSQFTVCEDDMDNRVLECAVDGAAQRMITGDFHLLKLKSFQGIEIVSVAAFLRSFQPKS